MKRAEDGEAKVLRLVEWHGQAARATVTFGTRLARARTATLIEDPVRTVPLAPDRRSVTLTLRPWEIVTLLVEDARKARLRGAALAPLRIGNGDDLPAGLAPKQLKRVVAAV